MPVDPAEMPNHIRGEERFLNSVRLLCESLMTKLSGQHAIPMDESSGGLRGTVDILDSGEEGSAGIMYPYYEDPFSLMGFEASNGEPKAQPFSGAIPLHDLFVIDPDRYLFPRKMIAAECRFKSREGHL